MKKLLFFMLLCFAVTMVQATTFSGGADSAFPSGVWTDGIFVKAINVGDPTLAESFVFGDIVYFADMASVDVGTKTYWSGTTYEPGLADPDSEEGKNLIDNGLQIGYGGDVDITLEGLEIGSTYRFQVIWGPNWGWAGVQITVPVDEDLSGASDSSYGSYSSGSVPTIYRATWTADAETQVINVAAKDNDGSQGRVLGYVLHKIVEETSAAHNPLPENGAIAVEPASSLTWNTALDLSDPEVLEPTYRTDITSHYVYLMTEPNLPVGGATPYATVVASGETGTTTFSGLETTTNYYWRVDESVNGSLPTDVATIEGPWWKFTTKSGAPIVLSGPPARTYTTPGDNTDITFEYKDTTSFQWYRYVDGIADTMLADGTEFTGTTTDTLTILDTQFEDEGQYYCVLSGDGDDAITANAEVATKRLIAYYQFEGDLTDSSLSGYDLALSGTAALSADGGLSGSGALQTFVEGDNATYYFEATKTVDTYTVMAWAKGTDIEEIVQYDSIVNNGDFQLGVGAGPAIGGFTAFDQWFHVALVYDGINSRYFINGGIYDENENFEGDFAKIQVLHNRNENATFIGLADEVKIYNYALTDQQIADDYLNVAGGETCLYPRDYDVNGDCVIDLADFASYAMGWYENPCGIYPAFGCE